MYSLRLKSSIISTPHSAIRTRAQAMLRAARLRAADYDPCKAVGGAAGQCDFRLAGCGGEETDAEPKRTDRRDLLGVWEVAAGDFLLVSREAVSVPPFIPPPHQTQDM